MLRLPNGVNANSAANLDNYLAQGRCIIKCFELRAGTSD